jgi:hypothetical protein
MTIRFSVTDCGNDVSDRGWGKRCATVISGLARCELLSAPQNRQRRKSGSTDGKTSHCTIIAWAPTRQTGARRPPSAGSTTGTIATASAL